MSVLIFLGLCLAAVSAVPFDSARIVGGSVTTIDNYPTIAAVLFGWDFVNFRQSCGGIIINQRSVLSAAHCIPATSSPLQHRIRVGSTWGNSGGAVHDLAAFFIHQNYNAMTFDSDIVVLRTSTFISYNNVVQPASIAGPNYVVPDNELVWAAGWGAIASGGPWSEQLRHVNMWTINQEVCTQKFVNFARINDNMLCTGEPNVGGLSTCQGDSGGPLYHQGVVVGVTSFGGPVCGHVDFAAVSVRVSRFTSWIQSLA
ncbi:trypsin, alkaline B-like [Anticarsia gemmatalis]|uniref:trypsin, alkaline B-like n=1 Tax=Anticarsia gemmatalis TaxID=129554 RepID=UPI003F769593